MKYALALVVPALLVVGIHAQTERIVLPRGPAPDQTVHMRMTQEMTLNLEPGEVPAGSPAASAIGAMALAMKMNIGQTLKFGPLDDRRRFDGVVTIDDATMDMTMNGVQMPMPGGMPLKSGQQLTLHYDENRTMTDVTGELPGVATDMLKKMFEGVMRSMPTTPIAVGETVAVPMTLPLPAMPTGPLGDMTGEMTMTLKSITTDGGHRLAGFDSTFSAKMASAPNTGAPISFDMRFAGAGTMVFDLDRGVARSSDQQGTIDGTMSMGTVMPSMKLHGTIKSTTQTDQ